MLELIATATFGLEALVAQEIKKLGYSDPKVENGKVTFKADETAVCRTNLWLRTADRVRLKVGEFKATTFEELFEKTRKLPWAEIIPGHARFPVEGKSVKSTLFSVSDCQAIVKKAVVESMKKKYKKEWFEEEGPLYRIEVALLKDIVTLTIDTSGPGLHKRGYREDSGDAPLRENLAAAMIILSRWQPDAMLIDPLCGSGTIPIEAAYIGKNIAPGINRSFVSEAWQVIPRRKWKLAREEAHDLASYNQPLNITGTDINDRVLKTARKNAGRAELQNVIHFQKAALSELQTQKKYGKIICNPPYGERSGDLPDVLKLYKEMGKVFRKLDTWSFYVLTSYEDFEKVFGKKATKKRKLYNGNLKVNYYQYFGPGPPPRKK